MVKALNICFLTDFYHSFCKLGGLIPILGLRSNGFALRLAFVKPGLVPILVLLSLKAIVLESVPSRTPQKKHYTRLSSCPWQSLGPSMYVYKDVP